MAELQTSSRGAPGGLKSAHIILAFFALATVWFVIAQIDINALNGLWIDEYFSIYASAPRETFLTLFSQRIFPDSNPPLYFSALAICRRFIADPRIAFITLNLIALAFACLFIMTASRRARLTITAVASITLFAVSGPALAYAPEGRSYFFALCTALAIAWSAAQIVETDTHPSLAALAALGALAALTHVYAALFAGSIGAGLLALGLWRRQYDLIRAGLALGAGATLTLGIWLIFGLKHASNVGFIEFTPSSVQAAVWYVRQLLVGPNLVGLAVAAFLCWSAVRRELWPLFGVFAIAAGLFVLLPLLVSFKMPLILGRYWMIGAPLLIVALIFAMRAHLVAAKPEGAPRRLAQAANLFGAACLFVMALFGFINARDFTAAKPIWKGADVVRDLLSSCPAGSVHITEHPNLYEAASGAPISVFVSAADETTPILDARSSKCPVLGWAEHVRHGDNFMREASDQDLLDIVKVAPSAGVRIIRHNSGFVVLRRGATTPD